MIDVKQVEAMYDEVSKLEEVTDWQYRECMERYKR